MRLQTFWQDSQILPPLLLDDHKHYYHYFRVYPLKRKKMGQRSLDQRFVQDRTNTYAQTNDRETARLAEQNWTKPIPGFILHLRSLWKHPIWTWKDDFHKTFSLRYLTRCSPMLSQPILPIILDLNGSNNTKINREPCESEKFEKLLQ